MNRTPARGEEFQVTGCTLDGNWSTKVEVFNNTDVVLASLRNPDGTVEWFRGVIGDNGQLIPEYDGHLSGNEDTARHRLLAFLR